jgi:PAS domain S-box-containing protein
VIALIIGSCLIFGLLIAAAVYSVLEAVQGTLILRISAPHLDTVIGAYTMNMAAVLGLQRLLLGFSDTPIMLDNGSFPIDRLRATMSSARAYYHLASYGGDESWEQPYQGIHDAVMRAKQTLNCSVGSVATSFVDSFQCFSPDLAFLAIEPIITGKILPLAEGKVSRLDPDDPEIKWLWFSLISPLYNDFFMPIFELIHPETTDALAEVQRQLNIVLVTLMLVAIIIEIIVIVSLNVVRSHIHAVLKLLLHCPPEIVLSTPAIMKILSGAFGVPKSEGSNRDSEFFEKVFANLPDAIMYANSELIIQAANSSCARILGESNLVGKNAKQYFSSGAFKGDVDVLFNAGHTAPTQNLVLKRSDGTEVYLETSAQYTSGKLVISCQDITQTVRYDTLILEERAKSDELLATILPPSLVHQVQSGDTNISFAVPSATIMFIDIVEFTPWCGSLDAVTVVSTLNQLFKRFDSALAQKPTMTKIKCIGDCYMAAGGIFCEVNRPVRHATEVVLFGLEAIKIIRDLNTELGEKLEIRVGANTGGPIVAGVLGIGKPTFEILGPAINMAQQMEHTGVRMAVQITRSVFELISAEGFNVRERGAVEIKGGSVVTYIVSEAAK